MRYDVGASDRQRRLAANEDAACAILSGWAAGDREQATLWQHWLGAHCVSRAVALGWVGIDPIVFARNPAWLGSPIATSEYDRRSPDFAVWYAHSNGDVLGIATYGVFWVVRADDAIPTVRLADSSETQRAATPGTERSFCCQAPVEVVLARPTREPLRIDEELDPRTALLTVETTRRCYQCKSTLGA